jgi:hypothetical protein
VQLRAHALLSVAQPAQGKHLATIVKKLTA